ncbi:hypothetical protein [Streptomyces sp. NPDC003374]
MTRSPAPHGEPRPGRPVTRGGRGASSPGAAGVCLSDVHLVDGTLTPVPLEGDPDRLIPRP